MFDKAKATAKKAPAKSKADKKERVEIPGLEQLAQINQALQALEALKSEVEVEVKDAAVDHFVTRGTEQSKRPDNFRGIEGNAEASCEVRKRSTASALSDAEQEVLGKFGISTEENVKTEEAFKINSAYFADQELLQKVSEQLEKLDDVPEDFIVYQEQISKTVTTAKSLDEVFQVNAKRADREALLRIVGTLAVKPKLNDTTASDAMKALAQAVGTDAE
ncbi:MAG: hypothetical protein ACR2PH_16920 [Desulfobulbia bacterium]